MRTPFRTSLSWLAVLGLVVAHAPAATAANAELERRSFLAEELAAAESKQFYLVVDAGVPAIDLKIEGVRVHRFALDTAEFGQSRLAGEDRPRWPAVSFSLVSEIPEPDRPRVKVQKADKSAKTRDASIKQAIAKGKQPTGELSQTAGEKVAQLYMTDDQEAPTTFRLQFQPGLVLVVRGEPREMDFGSRLRRIKYTLLEGWHGFGLWLGDKTVATRVVVYLSPQEARRLFKVLSPEIKLLVYAPPGR